MQKLTDVIKAFIKAISHSRVSYFGAILTTVIFPVLLVSTVLDLQGIVHHPYFGFAVYMVLGPLFILGLVLVFLGVLFFKGKEDIGIFTFAYLKEQFTDPSRFDKVRKFIFITTFLTLLNILIIALIGYNGYHYTESVAFCGQFCHAPMHPEFTAYQNSPHSRVPCVECHIGPGAQWFVKSKISGARQLLAVAFNTYSTPIETPVHGLRPASETCLECHRPEMFHGDKLYVKNKYLADENNSPVQTVLLMKLGSAGREGHGGDGIHWHVSPQNRITYKHSDRERQNITEVRLSKPDGTSIVYRKEGAEEEAGHDDHGGERLMDCIDCHNRPTHIYLGPDEALDKKIFAGEIPADLPFIKQRTLAAITADYPSTEEAKRAIAETLRTWYKENQPEVYEKKIAQLEKAILGAQNAYAENVFPSMKITWGSYQNFLGHKNESGCFRCHDDEHVAESGETISMDCETCHILLAEEEESPEILQRLRGQ